MSKDILYKAKRVDNGDEKIEYITKEVPICLGTKERETCTCGGYKSQCNFYREKFIRELEGKEKSK